VPQGPYITSPREHIILGSEGYTEGRKGGVGNAGNQGGMDTQLGGNFHGKVGSYQSPETWSRSPDYNAGQHPVNKGCGMLQTTGCQHTVTHPEVYTGKPNSQPSEVSNYDKKGSGPGNWRMGAHVSTSYTMSSPNPNLPYSTTNLPQTITPKENVARVHDQRAGGTTEGIQFMAPPYSGTGGHQYVPKYSKQSNDVGHSQ
jgi:hypothetical protein